MEGNELHPEVDDHGVHWFEEDEVEQLAKSGGAASEPEIARGSRRRDQRRTGGIDADRRAVFRSVAAAATIERDQTRRELAEVEKRASAAKAQLARAEQRIDELVEERRELRALLRTTASLLLEACDAKTLQHFDAELVATIRACTRLRD